MRDGDQVTYIGQDMYDVLTPGDMGRVLQGGERYAHVMWSTGALAGKVDLYDVEDLQVLAADRCDVSASLDDSLEVASFASLASAQDAYEETGGRGLAVHLASSGYLASYASLAEDALQHVVAGLQQDVVLRQLTAQMDPDEAEEVYRTAALSLISNTGEF